jgi:hypothetical protein
MVWLRVSSRNAAQQKISGNSREKGGGKHGCFRCIEHRRIIEGEGADEEGNREPDTGERADSDNMDPMHRLRKLRNL